MNFENLTIKQLRKLTEQYEVILKENKLLKVKYPTKLKEDPENIQDLIDDLGK